MEHNRDQTRAISAHLVDKCQLLAQSNPLVKPRWCYGVTSTLTAPETHLDLHSHEDQTVSIATWAGSSSAITGWAE